MLLFYLGIGGGIGALARFAVGGWVPTWAGVGFPWGTFAINVLGSALLGLLHGALPRTDRFPTARAFLTVGFCGGFTTFSTFDFETLVLLQQQQYGIAGLYSAGSVVACVVGALGGMALARSAVSKSGAGV